VRSPTLALRKLDRGIHARGALVVLTFAGELAKLQPAVRTAVGRELAARMASYAADRGFKGKLAEFVHLPSSGKQLVLALGLGERRAFELDHLRQATATALRTLEKLRVKDAVLVWPTNMKSVGGLHGAGAGVVREPAAVAAAAEGLLLGAYEFDKYKASAKTKFSIALVELAVQRLDATVKRALEETTLIADVVNWVRD